MPGWPGRSKDGKPETTLWRKPETRPFNWGPIGHLPGAPIVPVSPIIPKQSPEKRAGIDDYFKRGRYSYALAQPRYEKEKFYTSPFSNTSFHYKGFLAAEVEEGKPCLSCGIKCKGFKPHPWSYTKRRAI